MDDWNFLDGFKDKGIVYNPNISLVLEYFADADFAGNLIQSDPINAENVLSRAGFVLMYADCPITR